MVKDLGSFEIKTRKSNWENLRDLIKPRLKCLFVLIPLIGHCVGGVVRAAFFSPDKWSNPGCKAQSKPCVCFFIGINRESLALLV